MIDTEQERAEARAFFAELPASERARLFAWFSQQFGTIHEALPPPLPRRKLDGLPEDLPNALGATA